MSSSANETRDGSPNASGYDSSELAIPRYNVPPHPSEVSASKRPSSCRRRIVCVLCVTGIAIAAVLGIAIALTGDQGPQAIFIQEDPPGVNETNRWTVNRQRGLDVFVMNSCEDRWTPIFDEYIAAWDNGSPDALTITSKKFPHDPNCDASTGRINVCNADYGNTNWRGINTAFLQNGFVRHSVAKLNDFHLDRESHNQKRYTMCHELGHAFGLPHTDENYYNFDRGDCLDYTIRPRNNLQPGEFNFNLLYSLYGSVNGGATSSSSASETRDRNTNTEGTRPPTNVQEDEEEVEDDDDRRLDATPDVVMEKYYSVVACLETKTCSDCMQEAFFDYGTRHRMLHENEQGEACEFDIGDGYVIKTHKLLVN